MCAAHGQTTRRTGAGPAVVALLLAAAATAVSLFLPIGSTEQGGGSFEPCNQAEQPEVVRRCPPGATSVAVETRVTEDGRYVVRETVHYRSGRTAVREYTRQASSNRTTLAEEQPEAVIPLAAVAMTVAGFPLVLNRTRFRRHASAAAAALLLLGSLLAGFSVGVLYLPSAAAMAVAAARG